MAMHQVHLVHGTRGSEIHGSLSELQLESIFRAFLVNMGFLVDSLGPASGSMQRQLQKTFSYVQEIQNAHLNAQASHATLGSRKTPPRGPPQEYRSASSSGNYGALHEGRVAQHETQCAEQSIAQHLFGFGLGVGQSDCLTALLHDAPRTLDHLLVEDFKGDLHRAEFVATESLGKLQSIDKRHVCAIAAEWRHGMCGITDEYNATNRTVRHLVEERHLSNTGIAEGGVL